MGCKSRCQREKIEKVGEKKKRSLRGDGSLRIADHPGKTKKGASGTRSLQKNEACHCVWGKKRLRCGRVRAGEVTGAEDREIGKDCPALRAKKRWEIDSGGKRSEREP